jgi:hypothetical protein
VLLEILYVNRLAPRLRNSITVIIMRLVRKLEGIRPIFSLSNSEDPNYDFFRVRCIYNYIIADLGVLFFLVMYSEELRNWSSIIS